MTRRLIFFETFDVDRASMICDLTPVGMWHGLLLARGVRLPTPENSLTGSEYCGMSGTKPPHHAGVNEP
jgi:hypothetical protein